MLKVQLHLGRKWDREPGDHFYGEPFDELVEGIVGHNVRQRLGG
jgi:hypothetical protein